MKESTFWYTIALDDKYLNEVVMKMAKSFGKFNPNIPLHILTLKEVRESYPAPYYDHAFRITPLTMQKLIKDYDCLVRLDADQIITGNLEHVTEGDFDVAVVNNSSPRDYKTHLMATGQKLTLYDIDPLKYVNCGFVVVKLKRFVEHWWKLINTPFFNNYQFREQDMLNMLVHYFPYKVKYLDDSNKWHGLKGKGYWSQIEKRGGKLILPKNDEWPTDEDKEITAIHFAGGAGPKFSLIRTKFQEEVADYLLSLIK